MSNRQSSFWLNFWFRGRTLHEHYDDERHEQGHDEYDSKSSWSIQKSNRLRLDDDTTRRADAVWTSNERMLSYDFFFFREFDDLGTMHVDTAATISCNNSQLCIFYFTFNHNFDFR